MSFIISLQSEFLKVKRTPIIYLILIAAFIIPLIMVFDPGSADTSKPVNSAEQFYKEGFMLFVFVFLPFFYILASTLLMQIEVRNNAWKQVLASPQTFFHILLAKYTVLQVLAFAFLIIYNVYMAMSAVAIYFIYDLNFLECYQNWQELLKLNFMALGSTLGISTLSFWLALRSKNFIAPVAIGFLLWLIGPLMAFEFKWAYMDMYVSAIPFSIVSKNVEQERGLYQLFSIGYGVFFFFIAYLEFALKRIQWRHLFTTTTFSRNN